MALNVSTDMIKKLSDRERAFVDSFVELLGFDNAFLDKVCLFLAGKTNDEGLINDLQTLSGEGKQQACAEFIIIGLISGSIKIKDLVQVSKEHSMRPPLIKGEYHIS